MKTFPLEPIEKASIDELRALQLERLKWSLKHAYDNVAHYRKKFDVAGVKPGDLKTLADLANFPLTAKADLRETYPFGMFAVPMDQVVRIHASSGTTGKPTVVGYTAKDIDTWTNCMARSIRAAGARPGDKVHVAYGYGLFTGGLGAHYGSERLGLVTIPLSGGMTERQVQLITDFKPEIIMVTPSYMLAIADEMEKQGLDPKKCCLRIGIFGAEPWTNEMRKQIEQRLALDAIDIYGLSEVMGPGVSQECIETKDGLTIWEDHFYPEVIDPVSGQVLPDGEQGELVFTSLTKEALPVIRYRTRDLTRLLPGTARTMRRMEKITGRSDDMMIIRGVNVFPTQIEELILKQPELSPHYVMELSKDGPMDHLSVLVEVQPGSKDQGSAARLAHNIKSYVGVTADVRIVPISTIERSIGKAKRVVDRRGGANPPLIPPRSGKKMKGLNSKVALITGGGGAIGGAICRRFAEAGAKVVVADRNGEAAQRVASEVGGRALAFDISDYAAAKAAVDSVGQVDVLVNNAGWDRFQNFIDMDPADWEQLIAINLRGPLNMHHVVVPQMAKRGWGRVVNISSDAARVGSSGESVYSACKGGILAFSKTLARELARKGVTVNVVCPGPTDTPILRGFAGEGEAGQKVLDALVRAIPLKRVGQPEDMPGIVAFLASDEAAYITGQVISVSGGLTMAG